MDNMIKPREEVAKVTIARMAIYYSILKKIRDEGEQVCASTQLSMAYFGGFGTKGVGYEVEYLLSWVGEILGYNAVWNSVLVGRGVPFTGVGNYDRLLPPGFKIAAVVDLDKRSHGHKIPGLGLTVNRPGNLANLIKSQAILIGLLTVPTQEAREWQIPWLRQV